MSRIFISFSKDFDIALKLKTKLEEQGFDVWIYLEDIPPTADWLKTIYRGILDSDIFLFLISPDSIISDTCNKEIIYAVDKGKRIIPVVVRKIDFKDLPEGIKELQATISFEEKNQFDQEFSNLLKAINTDFKWVQFSANLQRRALEWESDNSIVLRGNQLRDAEKQLASVGKKTDPQPTSLQKKFVRKSREYANILFRRIFSLIIGVGVVIIFLGLLGIGFAFIAYQRNIEANEAKEIAETQEMIATGEGWATQSKQLTLYGSSMITSGLLAVEAARLNPNISSQQALSRYLGVSGNPIMRFSVNNILGSAAISPDGQLLAVEDGEMVKILDLSSGKEMLKIELDGSGLKFSPDGSKLLATGYQSLYIFNSQTGAILFQKKIPSARYINPMFSNDGKIVISLLEIENEGTQLIAYDSSNGDEISVYSLERDNATFVLSNQYKWAIVSQESDHETLHLQVIDWSNGKLISERTFNAIYYYNVNGFHLGDEKIVSIGEVHDEIEIWNVYTRNKFFSSKVCETSIHSISISTDKSKIAVGCSEGTVVVIDAQNFQIIMSKKQNLLEANTYDPIFYLDFNTEGNQIVTGGANATVIVWNIDTQEEIARMPYDGTIRYATFIPNQNLVVSIGSGNTIGSGSTIDVWYPENGLIKTEISQSESIATFSFSQDGNLLVASYGDTIQSWDFENNSLLKNIKVEGTIAEPSTFSVDGSLLISGAGYNATQVNAIDVETGKLLSSIEDPNCYSIDSLSLDNNSNIIISGCQGNGLMWNPYTGQILEYLSTAVLSPNGEIMAYLEWGDNGKKNLTIAETEAQNTVVTTHNTILTITDGNFPIGISPDSSLVAFTNFDFETMKVWNIRNNTEVFSIQHSNVITTIKFISNGKLIISTDRSGTVRVWETITGNEIASLIMPFQIIDVAISPDNKLILFRSEGVSLEIYSWKWNVADQIEEVCHRLPRNFTQTDWKQYIGTNLPYRATCPNLPTPTN